jgi:hypothetical protein
MHEKHRPLTQKALIKPNHTRMIKRPTHTILLHPQTRPEPLLHHTLTYLVIHALGGRIHSTEHVQIPVRRRSDAKHHGGISERRTYGIGVVFETVGSTEGGWDGLVS